MAVNLHEYDLVIINSSGGKDSLCAIWAIYQMQLAQDYPSQKIIVSHQDLGDIEWPGTKLLVQKQADLFGYKAYYSKRRTSAGVEETLLDYVRRRKKWPSNTQRYCTSDFKRGPGARIVTQVTKGLGKCNVLHIFGFRADESPVRSKKIVYQLNKMLTTKTRTVHDWLPIHDWNLEKVWSTIKNNNLPYHRAYDLGMPRLSCMFCIFSPFDALVIAGMENPELLDEYIAVEKEIDHTFQNGFAIAEVKKAIEDGYVPKLIQDWVM